MSSEIYVCSLQSFFTISLSQTIRFTKIYNPNFYVKTHLRKRIANVTKKIVPLSRKELAAKFKIKGGIDGIRLKNWRQS